MTEDGLADSSVSPPGGGLKLLASCQSHHVFHHTGYASGAV